MQILHTIQSLGTLFGGTTTSAYNLLKGLNQAGCTTKILTLGLTNPRDSMIGKDGFIEVLPNDAFSRYGYSRNLKNRLSAEDNVIDIYHINGMWLYVNYITAKIADRKQKPYVITLHGMLYPISISRKRLIKRIFLFFQFNRVLRNAACIHTTCYEEMYHYRELGFSNPVAVIPNSIPIPGYTEELGSERFNNVRIGFLGRLCPRKNIIQLIRAWSIVNQKISKDTELYIVGEGEPDYVKTLRSEVEKLNLSNVIFTGFLNGFEKYELLSTFTALVVPSDSENFGMIIPEALIVKVPVIASKGTPWEELNSKKCGWWVENDIQTLAATIIEAISLPDEKIEQMGYNGLMLVKQNYSSESVSEKMKLLYNWVNSKKDKPEFVYEFEEKNEKSRSLSIR